MSNTPEADTAEHVIPSIKGRFRPLAQTEHVQVEMAGLSDRGLVRTDNEDHFLTSRFGRHFEALHGNLPGMAPASRFEENGYGMAVADGMGGSAAGEAASGLAIHAFINLVLHTPDWIFRLDDDWEAPEMLRRGTERFEEIGQVLTEEATRDPRLHGFGTTLTVAWSLGEALFYAHVGDSRAYLFRGGRLQRLTSDHTLAQQLADRGVIPKNQLAHHRLQHVLTRWLGDHSLAVTPDIGRQDLRDGDCVLLCTDGLTGMVAENVIAEILGRSQPVEATCRELIDLALEAGGRDNVTAVLARYRVLGGAP